MAYIGLIVTGEPTFRELVVFIKCLEAWHSDLTLYVLTDSDTLPKFASIKTKFTLNVRATLDRFTGFNRSDMEARNSTKYRSLWEEFMYEKAEVLRWIFSEVPTAKETGVWYSDADIVHTAPLPPVPAGKKVALCPHMIRAGDAARFGYYNAGYLWISDPDLLDVWIAASPKSRFDEQAALEDVAKAAGSDLYEFPAQVNFGWWRMYQGAESPPTIQARFGINRGDRGIGIRYDGAPLQSIHTHFEDRSTGLNGIFNRWFSAYAAKLASHAPMRTFLRTVGL
jgi:hypothetical protein